MTRYNAQLVGWLVAAPCDLFAWLHDPVRCCCSSSGRTRGIDLLGLSRGHIIEIRMYIHLGHPTGHHSTVAAADDDGAALVVVRPRYFMQKNWGSYLLTPG